MTRVHATLMLLQHGPLCRADFIAITGWPGNIADRALRNLLTSRRITAINHDGKRRYAIAP